MLKNDTSTVRPVLELWVFFEEKKFQCKVLSSQENN